MLLNPMGLTVCCMQTCSIAGINTGDHLVPISKEVCNLGAMFDTHLTLVFLHK